MTFVSQNPEIALLYPLAIIFLTSNLTLDVLFYGLAGACFGFAGWPKATPREETSRAEIILAMALYAIGPFLFSESPIYGHLIMTALDIAFLDPLPQHVVTKRAIAILVMHLPFYFPRYVLSGILFLALVVYLRPAKGLTKSAQ